MIRIFTLFIIKSRVSIVSLKYEVTLALKLHGLFLIINGSYEGLNLKATIINKVCIVIYVHVLDPVK